MLTAIRNSDQKKVIAEFEVKGKDCYHCPDCQSAVILNKGLNKVDYFRHKRLSQCENQGESKQHMQIKMDLYTYLEKHWGHSLELIDIEYRLGGILRADVYCLTKKGKKVAFEVQVSSLTVSEVYRRTELYKALNVYVLWVLPFEYDRFYSYWTEKELAIMGYEGPAGYRLRSSVRFKDYELGIARLTYNYLAFWDLTHKKSQSFYILKLSDAFGEDSEYYDTNGQQIYYDGKRLKKVKSIDSYVNKGLDYFEPKYRAKFAPDTSYAIPERLVLLFNGLKKNYIKK